jgi:tripartite-type tricarboxylate transporter receptor subunit TctC
LGTNIIVQNKTGASGSVATEFVKRQSSNGYSILFNAENPPLYKVMGISNTDYDDFYPVILAGQQTAVLVVKANSPYDTVEDLFEDVKDHPGQLNLATTGAGALPATVASMMELTSDISFNQVPYDGDSAVLTAILGGNADCTVVNYSVAVDYVKDGSIKILAVFSQERLEDAPDAPTICESYPEYEQYFPWGTFVGVFVDDDCSDEVKETLSEGFYQAWETEGFQQFLSENYITPLGYCGDEARSYIKKWQQVTTWILYDAGQTAYSPEYFGIARLGEEESQDER